MRIIIDTSSLIFLNKHFYFDKYNINNNFNILLNFIKSKIENHEIVIIDKVLKELERFQGKNNIINYLKINNVCEVNGKDIDSLIHQNYLIKNEQNCGDIEEELRSYKWENVNQKGEEIKGKSNYADLFLVKKGLEFKNKSKEVFIITEESKKDDTKIIDKIPNICQKYKIKCKNLSYLLFEIYKEELGFKVSIKAGEKGK